jgi:hypothetical protein
MRVGLCVWFLPSSVEKHRPVASSVGRQFLLCDVRRRKEVLQTKIVLGYEIGHRGGVNLKKNQTMHPHAPE